MLTSTDELEGDGGNGTNGTLMRSGGLHDCHERRELGGVRIVWDGKSEGEDHMLILTASVSIDVIGSLQHFTGLALGPSSYIEKKNGGLHLQSQPSASTSTQCRSGTEPPLLESFLKRLR